MRKFILVAALVLASASAQAGGSRGLVMAAGDEPVTAAQPKAIEVPNTAEAPKFVERPAAVGATTDQPKSDQAKSDQAKPAPDKRADRPMRHRSSVRARIVYELHRHGVYW
jgi:hypothetical protein